MPTPNFAHLSTDGLLVSIILTQMLPQASAAKRLKEGQVQDVQKDRAHQYQHQRAAASTKSSLLNRYTCASTVWRGTSRAVEPHDIILRVLLVFPLKNTGFPDCAGCRAGLSRGL